MRDNLHKSETNVLNCTKIRNCIQSINLTSAWQEERTVRQEMQTRNSVESDSTLRCKSIQKNKHWNIKDWNVHKFIACSFEHAAE